MCGKLALKQVRQESLGKCPERSIALPRVVRQSHRDFAALVKRVAASYMERESSMIVRTVMILDVAAVISACAGAQQFVYPAKGQSPEQQKER